MRKITIGLVLAVLLSTATMALFCGCASQSLYYQVSDFVNS